MRLAVIAIMMFFALGLYADDLPPELAKALYEAQQMIKEEKYIQAVQRLTEFRKTSEDDSSLYYLLMGNALYSSGDRKKALQIFIEGHRKYPSDNDLCSNASITAYGLEDYKTAGGLFRSLYSLSGEPEHLFRSSAAFFLGNDTREAERQIDRLLGAHRQAKTEWLKLAVSIKMDLENWRGASGIITEYLKKNPDDEQMWRVKAQIHLNTEQFAEAASALETAYSIKPPKDQQLKNLADIYSYAGASVRAASTLEKISRTEKELSNLAEHYAVSGQFDRAVETADRLLKDTGNKKYITLKGKYLYLAGEYKEASEVLSRAEKKDGEALMLLAMSAWNINDLNTVKEAYSYASRLPKYRRTAVQGLAVVENLTADGE